MAKNVYSLQLLRNGTPFTSYTDAVDAITGGTEQDGVLKLARYTSNESDSATTKYNTTTVKTIFGIRHDISGNGTGWTIFDSYHEVIQNIQDQIDSMTGGAGSIAQQIQAALDQLDFSGATGNVITQVTQNNGLVTATGANVGTLELTGYQEGVESGHVEATDSINDAIAKLQNQIDAANDAKDAAIADLDVEDTAVSGQYVSQVTETDGKIAVSRVELPSLAEVHEAGKPIIAVSEDKGQLAASAGTINAEFVNVADAGNLFSSTTVEATLAEIDAAYKAADAAIVDGASESANTLGKLEDIVNDLNADAATYTIRKDTESLPAGVKERYTLVETKNGTPTDKTVAIDIPKDSHIVSIEYISDSGDTEHYQNLKYTYLDASGATQTVYVNMANLVFESEFKSGVTATDGIVHGVVDPTSESFLTVGENGFKLTGVSGLVDNQIAALDSTGGTQTIAAGKHVAVEVIETDGKITAVNVAEDNIASKSDLDALSAKTVTGVEMTGGTAAIDNNTDGTKKITINADGSTLKTSTAYASAQTASAVAVGDSIDTALGKLEAQVAAAKAAATTKVVEGTDAAGVMTIDENVADSGNTYTINLSNIAKADAVGLDANGSHVTTNGAYTSGATTIAGEIAALDAALNTVSGKVDDAQAEIDRIESGAGLNNDGTYSPDTTNTYTSGATSLADAIDKLDAAATANKIVAGDGIDVNETDDGTTVAVKLKDAETGEGDKWNNPLKFDNNGALYFNYIDAGTY